MTPQLRRTRTRIEAELERKRVVADFERSLVEVRVIPYRRRRSRAEMHQTREVRR